MGLENTVAHYEVQIVRTGTGALDAVADFKNVERAALGASVSFTELSKGTKAVSAAFKEFKTAAVLVGASAAPEVAIGIQAASTAFKGLRLAAAAGGVAMLEVGVIIAAVIQTVRLGIEAWKLHEAKIAEVTNAENLLNSSLENRKRLLAEISRDAGAGLISSDKAHSLADALMSESDGAALSDRISKIARELRQMFPDEQKDAKALFQLVDQMAADTLEGFEKERFQARLTYEERKAQLADLAVKAGFTLDQVVEQSKVADDWLQKKELQIDVAEAKARDERFEKRKLQIQTIIQMEDQAAQNFAQGFSQAFVDFASGTKSIGEAFKDFAVQFMQQVAQMIMQMLILRTISSAFGWGQVATPGAVAFTPMARGGVRFAADGIMSVSSPTYFPRFNTVAGEAGKEMLTVLARPRFMSFGGIEAVVGQAGSNTLAITQAAALAGGAGGRDPAKVEITLHPDLEGRIISKSTDASEVRIVQRAQQNSPVRDAIKRASA